MLVNSCALVLLQPKLISHNLKPAWRWRLSLPLFPRTLLTFTCISNVFKQQKVTRWHSQKELVLYQSFVKIFPIWRPHCACFNKMRYIILGAWQVTEKSYSCRPGCCPPFQVTFLFFPQTKQKIAPFHHFYS